MCGVLGIIGNENVGDSLFQGISELKHRGPNAWGVSIINAENRTKLFINTDNFANLSALRTFSGQVGVAHSRYITTNDKTSVKTDAQPLMDTSTNLVISYNGHIQSSGLREKLEQDGLSFRTNNDGELLLNFLLNEMKQHWKLEFETDFTKLFEQFLKPAVKRLMNEFHGRGAYTLVGMLGPYGLFAFRDPQGFRPLIFATDAKNGPPFVFSSETTVLRVLGEYSSVRQVEAGELIYISPDRKIHNSLLKTGRRSFCALEAVYFAAPDSTLGGVEIDQFRRRLGAKLAKSFEHLRPFVDVVTPIPETANSAAFELAFTWQKPFGGIIKAAPVRSFLEPNQARRELAADQKYRYLPSLFNGQRVALVDDSIVRGTTMKKIINNIRHLKAKEIHVFITFPPILHPCFYGIDLPDKKDLIAAQFSGNIRELTRALNINSLNFLSEKETRQALNTLEPLCMACATGKYVGGKPISKRLLHNTQSYPF